MMISKMFKIGSVFAVMSMATASPVALTAANNVSYSMQGSSQVAGAPASGETVVGAFPAPPTGSGPGTLAVWQPDKGIVRSVSFAKAGNSFYVAVDPANDSVFVPTAAGITYIVNTTTWSVVGQFSSLVGGRVAKVSPNGELLIVESPGQTAAYKTTAPYGQVFSTPVGGNALVVAPGGSDAFIGGNADSSIKEIALATGKIVSTFAVSQSGDMVWARGKIFSGDILTGVMSVINPDTGTIVKITTPEVDPLFSYRNIPAATAGFMQLAVSPGQRRVYAAGFSGHILAFSTRQDAYVGEVSVNADGATPAVNLLSGLTVLPGGGRAVVTIENLGRSVVVSLETGKILKSAGLLASNRWVSLPVGSQGS